MLLVEATVSVLVVVVGTGGGGEGGDGGGTGGEGRGWETLKRQQNPDWPVVCTSIRPNTGKNTGEKWSQQAEADWQIPTPLFGDLFFLYFVCVRVCQFNAVLLFNCERWPR